MVVGVKVTAKNIKCWWIAINRFIKLWNFAMDNFALSCKIVRRKVKHTLFTVSKNRQYLQIRHKVAYDLYGYINFYRSSVRNKTTFYMVLSWSLDCKTPWKFLKPLSKAVLGKFHESDGQVNAIVYMTWPVFTGLGLGKESWFLTLLFTFPRIFPQY